GSVEGAGPAPRRPGQEAGDLRAGDDSRVELIGPGVLEPSLVDGNLVGIGAQIHDAGGAEAGLGSETVPHRAPELHALDDERQLMGIAEHLAAPAPVAAGLLATDDALL